MADTASALKSITKMLGDETKSIFPGTAFAVLPSMEEFHEVEELSEQPYPPLVPENSGCIFDPTERTLQAKLWGKVVYTDEGIKVRPSWKMSQDKMVLSVEVNSEDFSGESLTLERVREHMPKALEGIILEMDFGPVEEALEESRETGEDVVAVVSQGYFPGEGHDAFLKLVFDADQAAGTLREDGSMDFRERADLHSVGEGDVLGEFYPAVVGDFGSDLFGNPIKPQEVKGLKVNVGQGVEAELVDNGMIVYRATRVGVARYHDDLLEVIELLEIDGDVDFSTGNIHAQHGSIHIKGDVKCGFTVECAGDVVIDGVVEEANIIAGGLVVAGGVIMSGDNKIKAEGDVAAHFFRNAIIEAGGSVSADQELAHCTVTAGGKVTVLGATGIISGGHIISGDDIHASIIGNKACVDTCVEIRLPSTMGEKLKAARKEFEKELRALDKAIGVDFNLSQLMSAPEEDRRILAELIQVRARIQKEIRSIDESSKALIKEAQEAVVSKRIRADQRAYPATEVVISGKSHIVAQEMDAPVYRFDMDSQQITWA